MKAQAGRLRQGFWRLAGGRGTSEALAPRGCGCLSQRGCESTNGTLCANVYGCLRQSGFFNFLNSSIFTLSPHVLSKAGKEDVGFYSMIE